MQRTVTHSACSRCSRLVCCCSLQLQRATLAALAAPLLKLSNWTHCVLVCNSDLCCHGQDHCKVNYALARRATQGKSQHVAVVRVRCTRPTNASRATFRPLAPAPDGLDAYDATRPRRCSCTRSWYVEGFTRLKRSSYARSCSETLRHISILAKLHIRKRKRRVQTS